MTHPADERIAGEEGIIALLRPLATDPASLGLLDDCAALTPRTRVLLLCSPSNPTGSMYTPQELAALADVVLEHDLLVVADEIYEHLVYPGHTFASFPTVRPGLQPRTVLVGGVSKTYAMTGWRIGWTLSPPEVARAMADLQSQETSNPCSISQ